MLFTGLDHLRQGQARFLDALGYGPEPQPSWIIAEMPGMRLRAYRAEGGAGPPTILVPAPIKRADIFDLAPSASVVRRCLEAERATFLVEWVDPTGPAAEYGLADYADRLLTEARQAAALSAGAERAVLIGHSLGGTLAAIHAARRPDGVAALVLLEAPLIFDPSIDAFAPWLRTPAATRRMLAGAATVPGSELSLAAVAAAPEAFFWHRWGDAFASLSDPERHELHLRVMRWALDELALSAPLLHEVLERLYRENRLRDGRLDISGRAVGLADIAAPILAVVESESRVVPRDDVLPALERTSSPRREWLTFDSEPGVALAHVGVLVGPDAHRRLWPGLLDWIAEVAG
jgi:polyhydroxyalkanoate synthase subunit PhaC